MRALPESGRFLQDTSHDVHLTAAVAEASQEIEFLHEEAAVQLDKNLVHHERSHYVQRMKLLLCEQPGVHPLQKVKTQNTQPKSQTHVFFCLSCLELKILAFHRHYFYFFLFYK